MSVRSEPGGGPTISGGSCRPTPGTPRPCSWTLICNHLVACQVPMNRQIQSWFLSGDGAGDAGEAFSAFKMGTIPLSCNCCRVVSRVEKVEQRSIWIARRTHGVIGQ